MTPDLQTMRYPGRNMAWLLKLKEAGEAAGVPFPCFNRSGYDLNLMIVGGRNALLAAPVEKTPLAALRKQQHQLMIYTGLPCVLYMRYSNVLL